MSDSFASNFLLESLEQAVLVVDQDGVLRHINLATEVLFEQSRRKLLGEKLDNLVTSPELNKCLDECLANRTRFTLREVSLTQRELLVDVSLSPISFNEQFNNDKGDSSVLIEINSVTRFKQFVQEKNLRERGQAFRLVMRGLAHEIKNPLSGIRGAAQLLHREIEDVDQQELTNILIKEADRLTRLVDRVMGSHHQLKLAPLNIHELLEHIVQLVTVNDSKAVEIQRLYDPTLPELNADREQLIQAMLNIVGNAIEAQSDLDKPVVGLITQFERAVTINQKQYRQALNVKIWDNGAGVPDELNNTLFDPLITGRAEGTGLGLSITQEIVQRHNGAIQLGKYNDKTCFTITLPYD